MTCAVKTTSRPWLTMETSRGGFVLRIAAGRGTTRIELNRRQAQTLVDRLTAALRQEVRPKPVLVEDLESWRDPEIL